MEQLSRKYPAVRETAVRETSIREMEQVSGPHEVEEIRVETRESQRGLLNEKAD